MLLLVNLVGCGAKSTRDATRDGVVSGVALSLLLVGFLVCGGSAALNGLGDVVGCVLDGVADLANEALIWLINVWCRHFGSLCWRLVGC